MADGKPSIARRLAVVVSGILIGVFLSHGLVGCVSGGRAITRVMDAFAPQQYELSEEGQRQMRRFQKAYDHWAARRDETQLRHFEDAYARIWSNYVKEVRESEMMDAAIAGLDEMKAVPGTAPPREVVETALDAIVATLDPHSAYLTAEELKDTHVSTKGEFGGLGIKITLGEDAIRIIAPIEDTPAYRAGIKAGDDIVRLDGATTSGMSIKEAVRVMRGRPGTSITLTVRRAGHELLDIRITRAVIKIKPVRWRVENDVGYIRVAQFTTKAIDGVNAAMADISRNAGYSLRGFVIDLRSNPGGVLDQAVMIADAFLEGGRIVSMRGRTPESERVMGATPGDMAQGLPIVAMIDEGSASASEIVASALQDNGRALIMGRRSFGKGSVQTITPLPIEGGLKLTTQLFYAPSGRAIQASGVAPDIVLVKPASSPTTEGMRREADLPGALPALSTRQSAFAVRVDGKACPPVGEKEDRELGCALTLLRAGSEEAFLRQVGGALPHL